jgi:putative membrane protein
MAEGVPPAPSPERRIDAFRRTHLANERTYLAWLRSGLTAVAVGLGVAKLLPDLAVPGAGRSWPYVALGIGFCVLGVLMMVAGVRRMRAVNRALARGESEPLDEGVATRLGVFTIALALATIAVIILD